MRVREREEKEVNEATSNPKLFGVQSTVLTASQMG